MSKPEPGTISFDINGRTTAETKLTVYTASHHTSTVRMEVTGFGSEIIKVHERTSDFTTKFDLQTLLCLRDVLNRWYEKDGPK